MSKKIFLLLIIFFSFNCSILKASEDVMIHGFISQGYLKTTEHNFFFSDTKDGTFQFNEMGIKFGTNLTESLTLGIQFLAKDLGIIGNDEVTIDYAMADYAYRDWFGVRIGKMKLSVALYNATRDFDAGRLSIFLPQSVYNEMYRDQMVAAKGVAFYGRLFNQIDYHMCYGLFNVDTGLSMLLEHLMSTSVLGYDVDPTTNLVVLWNTPLQGLSIGGTHITYRFAANTELGLLKLSGYQAIGSVEYIYGGFMFSAEFFRQPNDVILNGVPFFNELENYYAMAGYSITDWFEFGGGYSVSYNDIDKRDEPGQYLKDLFVSLRFDINDNWIFKLEGHKMNGLLWVTVADSDPPEDWYMLAAKSTFSF